MTQIPEHERIFEEICGKLNELSRRSDILNDDSWSGKIERMQTQLKRSQDELKSAQSEIQEKIKNFDSMSLPASDVSSDLRRATEQLDAERSTNSRLSADLAKSLELNLKLQFEIEEMKSKANQIISEERKHNQYLAEKNKAMAHEMELVQALNSEVRSELVKAKESIQVETEAFHLEKESLLSNLQEQSNLIASQNEKLQQAEALLEQKQNEIASITESLSEFETHSLQQNEAMKNLSGVAEKKIIELKMALDKKSLESQDYYSHLQQSLAQSAILKQENVALKEYISKISQLQGPVNQQGKPTEVRA